MIFIRMLISNVKALSISDFLKIFALFADGTPCLVLGLMKLCFLGFFGLGWVLFELVSLCTPC